MPTRRSGTPRLVALLALGACGVAPDVSSQRSVAMRHSAGGNITAGCVASYDSSTDYFPEKSNAEYAAQFRVEYFKHYKVLTITPREDSTLRLRYALVQCGTPIPAGFDPRRVIEVPVQRLAVTYPDYNGVIDTLDLYDRLVAVGQEKVLTFPRMRAAVDSGHIAEVGSQHHLDLERLIALKPDVILSYWSVNPEANAPAKVDEVGLKSGALVAHWEVTPLGALDWIKVVALYVNREGDANRIVAGVSARYDSLRETVRPDRRRSAPSYITHVPTQDAWQLERTGHRTQRLMRDAGLEYDFASLDDRSDFPSTSLEAAIAAGRHADFWFDVPAQWRVPSDIWASDDRLRTFDAARGGNVFSWHSGPAGSDRVPYNERWLTHPDEVLQDIIAATRPMLLPPGYRFHYLRRVVSDTPSPVRRGGTP